MGFSLKLGPVLGKGRNREVTRPASISQSFSSRIPTCLLGCQAHPRPPPASPTARERHPETERKARLLHFLKAQSCLPSGLWAYRPVLIAWPLLTSWLASQNWWCLRGREKGKVPGHGAPTTHSLTPKARPDPEQKASQTLRCLRPCDPQESEERGEGYMFNKKQETPQGEGRLRSGRVAQHPGEPPWGLLSCSLRSGAL